MPPGLRPDRARDERFLADFLVPRRIRRLVAATSLTNPPTGALKLTDPVHQPSNLRFGSTFSAQRSAYPQQAAQRRRVGHNGTLPEPAKRSTCHAESCHNLPEWSISNCLDATSDGAVRRTGCYMTAILI
jgi:hypothetical protein